MTSRRMGAGHAERRHGSCCVGGKQLGQKDFEQEGQDIVPPNASTSPQDVHLSLGEGQGLGSS